MHPIPNMPPKGNIALVGGTGFEQLPPEIYAEPVEVETRHGMVRVLSVSNNYVEPYKLYFLSRHGAAHGLAPHEINYRANIAALVELDVGYVIATNAVGSLRVTLPVGSLVVLDDFLDFTKGRPQTYFSPGDVWQHVDFSTPYSPLLRAALIATGQERKLPLVETGTYLCCDGPRFESPAEVRLFAQWGADVVGMTGLPEAIFAKEAGLEYAALAIVTNLGAGLSPTPVAHEEVVQVMAMTIPGVRELLLAASANLIDSLSRGALEASFSTK